MTSFDALGLSPAMLKATQRIGFSNPTPIQRDAIPLVISGQDIMGLAQTGTGKTAAFGLPMVDRLLENREKPASKNIRALILAPTRELVNQIVENLRAYVKNTPLKIDIVIGGASVVGQKRRLERGCDILVATPGRLLDHVERKNVFLDRASILVLDEADQMLDLGFIHDLRKIARHVGHPRQTLLFSATMAKQINELAQTFLNDPVRVEVSPPGKSADKVRQAVHFLNRKSKGTKLHDLLIERRDDLSLVFCRTKHGAEKLKNTLVEAGFAAASIHGNKSQGQRDRAIKGFKSGETRVLVATDVAARGIDISGVTHVYNFDLPEVAEAYVHRIGRTARAGKDGCAVTLCAPDELKLLRAVENLMGIRVDVVSGEVPNAAEIAADKQPKRGSRVRLVGRGRPNGIRGGKPRKGAPISGGPSSGARPKPKRKRVRNRPKNKKTGRG
ncbi:MAG: DEAD/DEAH box helicase [Rhizobiaceae bacterium]